jgi:DNA-3-methyladenine glycosylase I
MTTRCTWPSSELDIAYHDQEWGVPVHDDRVFFEFLTLEGAQAGLSWSTILNKRENYRRAFAGFDPTKVARFTACVGGRPRQNARKGKDIPARTMESDALSKDLKRRGFRFVGSTICYAFMQATGMVNDHLIGCYRYRQLAME